MVTLIRWFLWSNMKLKKIELTNFRAFDQLTLNLQDDVNVLVAWNGQGKTSILDAIAQGFGPFLSRLPKISGIGTRYIDIKQDSKGKLKPFSRISLELSNGTQWDLTEKRDQTKKTANSIPAAVGRKVLNEYVDAFIDKENEGASYTFPILAYYGTGRGVFDIPERRRSFQKSFSRFESLTDALHSRVNFKRFFEWFYAMEDQERREIQNRRDFDYKLPALEAIRTVITGNSDQSIQGLLPSFSNPRTETSPLRFLVDWQRDDGHTDSLRIDQLSDGFRTTLAMAMDIAGRMAEANPDADDILSTPGIVLIDEIDLHLHPEWQQRILPDLQNIFKNIQWIVSTHSPQVMTTVEARCIHIIRNDSGNAYIESPDFSLGAQSSEALNGIQGVPLRPESSIPIVKDLVRYKELVKNEDEGSKEGIRLRNKLNKWGKEHVPELMKIDLDIRLRNSRKNRSNKK